MRPDLAAVVPRHKSDTESARAVVALGYPAVEPIVPGLLQWLQDINWPVAHILAPFLANVGSELAPHVRSILETDDDVWKYCVVRAVVAQSHPLSLALKAELERLAHNPTPSERFEEVNEVALEALERLK